MRIQDSYEGLGLYLNLSEPVEGQRQTASGFITLPSGHNLTFEKVPLPPPGSLALVIAHLWDLARSGTFGPLSPTEEKDKVAENLMEGRSTQLLSKDAWDKKLPKQPEEFLTYVKTIRAPAAMLEAVLAAYERGALGEDADPYLPPHMKHEILTHAHRVLASVQTQKTPLP